MASPSTTLSVYPPIYRLGKVGRALRDSLMTAIIRGTPVLMQIQSFRSPSITTFMKGVSFLGEEEFYTVLVPFVTWTLNFKMGCLLAILMGLGFCVGGFLKNILCLPRPPSPPIIPADHCHDWSFPSHHAILNVTIPWYIWIFCYTRFNWSPLILGIAFVGVSFWCFSILFSRLYLGVHSPADIMAGGIIGCLLLVCYLLVDDILFKDFMSSLQFSFLCVLFMCAFLAFFPDPHPRTIIVSETAGMLCVSIGIIVGVSLNRALGLKAKASFEETDPLYITACLRYFVGIGIVLFCKIMFGIVTKFLVSNSLMLLGLQHHYTRMTSDVLPPLVHYSPGTFVVLDKVNKIILYTP